jgi:hypothetical protein
VIITNEYNELIFEHYVGSKLIDNCSENSDIDLFSVYKNDLVIVDPGLWEDSTLLDIAINNVNTSVIHYDKLVENVNLDVTNVSILDLLNNLSSSKIENSAHLSKIVSHLYAVKYNLISEIKNQELFNLYVDWLKTPTNSGLFWYKIKTAYWARLSSLPDRENNWSQEYDSSDKHTQMKKDWEQYDSTWPVVDNRIGYDGILSKKIIQSILIATCVLTPNKIITTEEKQYLNKIREGLLSFEDYKVVKSYVWKKFRSVSDTMTQCYYLGEGYSIEEAKQKNMYGIESFFKFLSKVSSTKVLSIDNNLNTINK